MLDRINLLLLDAFTRLRREEGQGVVEYALILGLIVAGAVALLTQVGGAVTKDLTSFTSQL